MAPSLVFAWGLNTFGQCLIEYENADETVPMQVAWRRRSSGSPTASPERRSLGSSLGSPLDGSPGGRGRAASAIGGAAEGPLDVPQPRCANAAIGRAVPASTPIRAVACGEAHTLVLTLRGDVFACGRSREGQLGVGMPLTTERGLHLIEDLRPYRVEQIACGNMHSVAVTSSGHAFEWGLLLPLSKAVDTAEWAEKRSGIGKDFNEDLNDKQRRIVAQSWSHYMRNSAAADAEDSEDFDTRAAVSMLSDAECRRLAVRNPRLCGGLEGLRVRSAACGYAHTVLAVGYVHKGEGDSTGVAGDTLVAAGYGEKGQLGDGGRCSRARFAHVAMPPGAKVVAGTGGAIGEAYLACGLNHTAAIAAPGGQLLTWGYGVFGQLGLGHGRKEQCTPQCVDLPSAVLRVACGENHTLAATEDGSLYAFGHRDAVGGASHRERLPERRQDLSCGSGERVQAIFAGGAGCFALPHEASVGNYPALYAWGYNQRLALGHFTPRLDARPGPVAFPPLPGAVVTAFSAGANHCVAVLESPRCCVLPPGGAGPFLGARSMLQALAGAAPYDVHVRARGKACNGGSDAPLGAHRSILLARCPSLAEHLEEVAGGGWSFVLSEYTVFCVAALLEYLYTDYCRVGADVAAELKRLAKDLGLGRLLAGVCSASETDSVSEGVRWARTASGRWEQVAVAQYEADQDVMSTYAEDLQRLVVEVGDGVPPTDGFVELVVRDVGGAGAVQRLHVARALLLTNDFFRTFLEGDFSEAVELRSGRHCAELIADDTEAFMLCLRAFATGAHSHLRTADDPQAALALLAEAHRLELHDIVGDVESALSQAVAEGRCAAQLPEVQAAARIFSLPRLAQIASEEGRRVEAAVEDELMRAEC